MSERSAAVDPAKASNPIEVKSVVIVGGGPVGLVAALSLAKQGHAVTVIEADEGICDGSRAICISRRSLQVLDRLGVADTFLAKGLHWTEGRSYLGSAEIFHLQMPTSADDRFPPFINLQQFHAERFLVEACEATGLVDIRWGHRVTGFQRQADHVALRIEAKGQPYDLSADWVVASDGGRSFIREQGLGLSLEGKSYESRYLIADIELACDWPTERKVWFDPVSNPGSTVIMHRQPDNVWRIDYQLLAHEDPDEALKDDNIRARISAHLAMVGLPKSWKLIWKSLYRAHTLSLRDYVHNRVLFAGDAAHLVPIFGVRGLNSGIDDAANLAWKLGLVAKGKAPAALLQSYTQERRAACMENIESATKTTWFMSPPSEGFVLARDAVVELATRHRQFSVLIDPRQASAHHYRSSAIETNTPSAFVGLPLPEVRLSDGRSLHEVIGQGVAVLGVSAESDHLAISTIDISSIPVVVAEVPARDALATRLKLQPGALLLIRPDGYVAATGVFSDRMQLMDVIRTMLGRIGVLATEERYADVA